MLPEKKRPPLVAIMDSGVGGLPYLESARNLFPSARFVYLADRAGFPYGTKTREEVESIVRDRVTRLLVAFDPDALVIACNTASQAALSAVRADHPELPIIGTVPAIKPAASDSKSKIIGVLATDRSVVDPYLDALEDRFAASCRVERRGAQDLVDFIERRFLTAEVSEILEVITPHVAYLIDLGVDRIVLACTHFLHVAKEIEALANELAEAKGSSKVRVVDSREGVARRLCDVLNRVDLSARKAMDDEEPSDRLFLTGDAPFEASYGGFAARYGMAGPYALDGIRQ